MKLDPRSTTLARHRQIRSGRSSLEKISAKVSTTPASTRRLDENDSRRFAHRLREHTSRIAVINDTLSMVQSAQHGFARISETFQELRRVTNEARDAPEDERETLSRRVESLRDELDVIIRETAFKGSPLLDGSASPVKLSAPNNANVDIEVELPAAPRLPTEKPVELSRREDAETLAEALEQSTKILQNAQRSLEMSSEALRASLEALHVATGNITATGSTVFDAEAALGSARGVEAAITSEPHGAVSAQAAGLARGAISVTNEDEGAAR